MGVSFCVIFSCFGSSFATSSSSSVSASLPSTTLSVVSSSGNRSVCSGPTPSSAALSIAVSRSLLFCLLNSLYRIGSLPSGSLCSSGKCLLNRSSYLSNTFCFAFLILLVRVSGFIFAFSACKTFFFSPRASFSTSVLAFLILRVNLPISDSKLFIFA